MTSLIEAPQHLVGLPHTLKRPGNPGVLRTVFGENQILPRRFEEISGPERTLGGHETGAGKMVVLGIFKNKSLKLRSGFGIPAKGEIGESLAKKINDEMGRGRRR